jgi:adenylate cyclase
MTIGRLGKGLLLGAVIGVAGALFALTPLGMAFEETVGLTWLFKVRGPVDPPREVAVVGIDRASADALGLPPQPRKWPRSLHARLIDTLVRHGASVIVFDLILDAPGNPVEDATLAKSIRDAGRVVLFEHLERRLQPLTGADGTFTAWVSTEHLRPPLPFLAEAARGLGPFPLPRVPARVSQFWAFKRGAGDVATLPAVALQVYALDAYERWRAMLQEVGAPSLDTLPQDVSELTNAAALREVIGTVRTTFKQHPEFALRIAETANRSNDHRLASGADGGRQGMLDALARLYGGDDSYHLNFYGPPGHIKTIPYHVLITDDAVATAADGFDLAGRCVFVGWSELAIAAKEDGFYTVFSRDDGIELSGVEIAATAFANMLTGIALRPTSPSTTAAMLLVLGLVVGAGASLLPALAAVPLVLFAVVLYAVAAQLAFNGAHVWPPMAIPLLLQVPMALFAGTLGQYLFAQRRRRQATRAIGYYLPQAAVRVLTASDVDPRSINKVAYATCLASDAQGFTTVSETMAPGDSAAFLNEYFDALSEPIDRHQVDVREFRADGVMCAWTSPEPEPAVRAQACRAAVEAIEAIDRFNQRHAPLMLPTRIGLHAGEVFVGHSGGGGRFVYSVIGDIANAASRVEGLNKHVGTHLLATGSVVDGIDDLLVRPLGQFRLVGKTAALPIVEILATEDRASDTQRRVCERFAEALEVFRAERWAAAADLFEAVLRDHPADGPSQFLLERCRRYLTTPPPPDESAVIQMEAK